MDNQQASRIELILGDAVLLLSESGASPSVVGSFAVKFAGKLANRLSSLEASLAQLESQTLAPKVTPDKLEAVLSGLSDRLLDIEKALALRSLPTPVAVVAGHVEEKPVRLKVKTSSGTTSITIAPSLLEACLHAYGTKKLAQQEINRLYAEAPADATSKSKWVASQLRMSLESSSMR